MKKGGDLDEHEIIVEFYKNEKKHKLRNEQGNLDLSAMQMIRSAVAIPKV